MKFNPFTRMIVAAGVAALPSMAVAQQIEADQVVALNDWRYDDLYTTGISIDEMLDDAEVYGPTGDDIGSVENVIVGEDGRVLSIIAQVGGLWDIGDTHVSIPWSEVQITAEDRVTIPVTEETVENYSVFNDDLLTAAEATGAIQTVDDDLATGPRAWRATELIGDYARVREGEGFANYGYIDDLIVRDGQIAAVVVRPDVGWAGERGPYAYPYYGYGSGWNPGRPYYDLPYDRDEIGEVETFDYDRMGG